MTTTIVYYHFMGATAKYCANCKRFESDRHATNWMNYMERTFPTFIVDEVYR